MSQKPADASSPFDRKDPHPERSVKTDPAQKELLKELETGLEGSFPASDAVSVTQPTVPGEPQDGDA